MPTRNLVSCDQKMRKQKTDCFFLLQFSSFVGANFVIVTSRKFGDFNSLMCGVACGFRWFPCGVTGGFFFSFYRALFGLLLTLVVCVCVRVLSICVTLWLCERKQQVYCRAARFIFSISVSLFRLANTNDGFDTFGWFSWCLWSVYVCKYARNQLLLLLVACRRERVTNEIIIKKKKKCNQQKQQQHKNCFIINIYSTPRYIYTRVHAWPCICVSAVCPSVRAPQWSATKRGYIRRRRMERGSAQSTTYHTHAQHTHDIHHQSHREDCALLRYDGHRPWSTDQQFLCARARTHTQTPMHWRRGNHRQVRPACRSWPFAIATHRRHLQLVAVNSHTQTHILYYSLSLSLCVIISCVFFSNCWFI